MKLDDRTRALIAVGAAIAANCQPCLENTTTMARESGADEIEIAEAIEVGKMVRRGAASKMDKFAAGLNQAAFVGSVAPSGGCGCNS